jgi:hypothetical protein
LRRKAHVAEASLLAQEIDDLRAKVRSKQFSKLHHSSPDLSWKSVDHRSRDSVLKTVDQLINDIDNACDYFAPVSFDSTYNDDNILRFYQFPQNVHAGPYLTPSEIFPFSI